MVAVAETAGLNDKGEEAVNWKQSIGTKEVFQLGSQLDAISGLGYQEMVFVI